MARKKTTLVRTIRLLSIIPFAVLAAVISVSQILSHNRVAQQRAQKMRVDYVVGQKALIKREVEHVVTRIRTTTSRNQEKVSRTLKERAYEAHAIAETIYRTYRNTKTDVEIQKMIISAIRPIRYWRGMGYHFILEHDGVVVLHADRPLLEGKYLASEDPNTSSSAMDKILAVARKSGEGHSRYKWTKPGGGPAGFQKTSYVKQFKPYNWIIGTGLYADDIEAELKRELLRDISDIRFGKEGYIFVNRLNGDALVSNGKIFHPTKKLWDVFNKNPEAVKKVFALEYQAAQNPKGDYIYYSWEKLTSTKTKSPKASFVFGLPELGWLIGAGVYLDDVESTISQQQRDSTNKLRKELVLILLLTIGLISLVLFVVHKIGGYLLGDVQLFVSFLKGAAQSNTKIDTSNIRFEELSNIGADANTMLADKMAAEEKVLREKEQLAVTLRSIGDGVITTDLQGRIVLINRITEDLTGWTQTEARDRPVEDVFRIVNEQTGETCPNPVTKVFATGKKVDLANHTALVSRDGTKRVIEDTAAPICDKDSNVSGAVLVYRDVTEERRTAMELLKIEKLESVGVLAGGLAHDFNNILSAILGNIELGIGRAGHDTELRSLLVDAQKASVRAIGITQQLLTFGKGGDPVRKTASLDSIIRDSSGFVLRGSSVECVYDIPPDLWPVDVDSGQMAQVIQNIVLNARDVMETGGTISISCENVAATEAATALIPGAKCVTISISDTGPGIPPTDLEKIFDPYYSTKPSGSGLGLAICHSIVRKHEGHLTVSSPKSGGTTFEIWLPASTADHPLLDTQAAQKPAPHPMPKGTILVLDDEEIVRKVVKRMLREFGHTVILAAHGREAIDLYAEHLGSDNPIDVVIMDLTIPGGMGGEESVKEILQIDPEAKVVVASGYSTAPVMANHRDYGFVASISKPYRLGDLSGTIEDLIGPPKNRGTD